MYFIQTYNKGRFGNSIFRFLASRLFIILYNSYTISKNTNLYYYYTITDTIFIQWMIAILSNNSLPIILDNNIIFDGFFQHDIIYKKFKNELIEYIKNNPKDELITDTNELYYAQDILGPKPIIHFTYKTTIHLRIEDFLELNLAMDQKYLDSVLEKCEQPFLFIHKKESNNNDIKYIDYFKLKYPTSYFYTENVILSYNLMRHAEVLVCSRSTMSWLAAFFSDVNIKTYMPKNYGTLDHETFQYPTDNTEIYEWRTMT
jgi:hypothetical protein